MTNKKSYDEVVKERAEQGAKTPQYVPNHRNVLQEDVAIPLDGLPLFSSRVRGALIVAAIVLPIYGIYGLLNNVIWLPNLELPGRNFYGSQTWLVLGLLLCTGISILGLAFSKYDVRRMRFSNRLPSTLLVVIPIVLLVTIFYMH